MSNTRHSCEIGGTQCLISRPQQPTARLVLAHGAGAAMDSPFMERMAALLCEQSLEVIRFEFPYMARRRQSGRRSPPDRTPVLLDTWRQIIEALTSVKPESEIALNPNLPLFIGGKSMGGRMATMAAALPDAPPVRGVICLGYPFHPQGKPEKLRTEHLAEMAIPTLIVQGTRDPLGKQDEVAAYPLSAAISLAWIETGDHDLKPLQKSGLTHEDCLSQAAAHVAAFVQSI